jgi:hypothetical protein
MALSYVQYAGNGSQETFAIPFPYLNKSDISVKVDLDLNPSFTFDDAQTIRISPAPAAASVVELRRNTPRDTRLVDFTDGSVLTESDLDLANIQVFYIVQEAIDIAGGTLELLADASYSAGGRRVSNIGDPINANDAVNKQYFEGTFLSQMTTLLNQTTAAKNTTETLKNDAAALKANYDATLAAAVAARDLALQYRDTTKGYRDEVSAWNANVNTKSANVDTKNDNVNAKSANVDTKATQVAADTVTAGEHAAWAWTQAERAETAADAAATFDPALFLSKAGNLGGLADPVAARQNLGLSEWGHGGCRLVYTSTTLLTLQIVNGGRLIIDGKSRQLVQTTFANTQFTTSTMCFIYAYWTGSAVAYEVSATHHATHTNGVEIKSGDPTRTLVGAVWRWNDGLFYDNDAIRAVASWFNRRPKHLFLYAGSVSTASTSQVALGTAYGIVWAGETCDARMVGYATSSVANMALGAVIIGGNVGGNESGGNFGASTYFPVAGYQVRGAQATTTIPSFQPSARGNGPSITVWSAVHSTLWL